MLKNLKKLLASAEGRSEFVIAVFCDIRGFSCFSTVHESPDIAMFIKRFYMRLLEEYFATASFAKTTGDGLLMSFRYSEKTLNAVAKTVLEAAFKAMGDFPKMFAKDPMINFETPGNLGFGVTRGTACCLFSGRQILDYSGHILNLAARLTDLARPKGIIIDGAFQKQVIPETMRQLFLDQRAYIRSIAEEASRELFCSKEVTLPDQSQAPLTSHQWVSIRKQMTVSDLMKLDGTYSIRIPKDPLAKEHTKLEFSCPSQKLPGHKTSWNYGPYEVNKDANGIAIRFDISQAKDLAQNESLAPETIVAFEFQYVPKPRGRGKK